MKKSKISSRITYEKYEIVYVDDMGGTGSVKKYARPAVILQNNKGNLYSPTTIVAFITGKAKREDLPTHVVITNYNLPYKSTILLEQVATIPQSAILSKIDYLRPLDRGKVDKALAVSLGI